MVIGIHTHLVLHNKKMNWNKKENFTKTAGKTLLPLWAVASNFIFYLNVFYVQGHPLFENFNTNFHFMIEDIYVEKLQSYFN